MPIDQAAPAAPTTESPKLAPVTVTPPDPRPADRPRDDAGRFAKPETKAPEVVVVDPVWKVKDAPKEPEVAKPDQEAQKAAQTALERQDAQDADAYALVTGAMTQAAYDAKWNAPPAEAKPKAEEGRDAGDETPEKTPEKPAEPPAEDATARSDALEVLRRDYGVAYTRDHLAKLPLDVLKGMAAERRPRQDKVTRTIETLKAGKGATLREPEGTTPEDDESPTTGAIKQRTPATDPLDEDLDALSDLDPEASKKVREALKDRTTRLEEAERKAEAAVQAATKARFQAAMLRATEAHPELKNDGVRQALLSAMEAKDPKMRALASDDDDDLEALIETCAERVIPKTAPRPEPKPKGAPDMDSKRTQPRQMTQDDRDALAWEAIQKVGSDPAAVNAYIQRKLGQL